MRDDLGGVISLSIRVTAQHTPTNILDTFTLTNSHFITHCPPGSDKTHR